MSDEKKLEGKTEVKLAETVLNKPDEQNLRGLTDIIVEKRVAFGGGIQPNKVAKIEDERVKERDRKHESEECEEEWEREPENHKDCRHCGEWECDEVLGDVEFPCHCDPVKSGLTDVVDSVAHQEFGIAKILESESKKICKAIGIARSIDDLVKIDKSVQDTIKQINHVQIVLLDKLQEVSDICDGCGDDCGCK